MRKIRISQYLFAQNEGNFGYILRNLCVNKKKIKKTMHD